MRIQDDKAITVEQFMNRELNRLTRFRQDWKVKQADAPDDYPATMPEAEWAEHYRVATEEGIERERVS